MRRKYPLQRPTDEQGDPRFNIGLLRAVGKVLSERGYPELNEGADLVNLQQALFGFIYGDADRPGAESCPHCIDRLSGHDPECPKLHDAHGAKR